MIIPLVVLASFCIVGVLAGIVDYHIRQESDRVNRVRYQITFPKWRGSL